MFKCNEDSCSDSEEEQVSIEKSLVTESMVEVDHLICTF